jgi:chromosome segregation ATPase
MDENTEKIITKIVDSRLEAISKKVDTIQKTVDLMASQLGDDRKDISDMRVNMGKLEAQVGGARDDIEAQTKKVVNKVDEHLQPMPDMISDAVESGISQIKKKKWYEIWKKGGE